MNQAWRAVWAMDGSSGELSGGQQQASVLIKHDRVSHGPWAANPNIVRVVNLCKLTSDVQKCSGGVYGVWATL